MKFFYILLFVASLFTACSGGKKVLKEAKIYEDGGLSEKAIQSYSEAYYRHGRAEGFVGMRRISQEVLRKKFVNAQSECMRQNFDLALSLYDEAFSYYKANEKLELQIPSGALDQQSDCKSDYINFLFDAAELAVKEERFEEAREYTAKIRSLDRTNKKAEYLDILSRIYPSYNLGLKAEELGLWRDAYNYFLEVTQLDAGFKDALQRRNNAMEKAKYTIAFIPIKNQKVDSSVETALSAAIKQQILALKSPFIDLLERERLDQMINEQMMSMNPAFDQNKVIEAGKLTGARYILSGELINYDHKFAQQRAYERKGFLGSNVNAKKIKYTEYRLGRGLDASFKYQILDAETGKVYATDVITFSDRDNVVYSEFEGDYSKVYPGAWKWQLISNSEDVVYVNEKDRLMKEFTGRKGPVSEIDLRNRMMKEISEKVARAVEKFKP